MESAVVYDLHQIAVNVRDTSYNCLQLNGRNDKILQFMESAVYDLYQVAVNERDASYNCSAVI